MRLNKLIVILFCLIPLVITADKGGLKWMHRNFIDVDHVKENPGHTMHPDKYLTDADLSADYQDEIVWYSKDKFFIVKIDQLNPGNPPTPNVDPFVQLIRDMKSNPFPNGKEFVASGPPRKDLVFTSTYKGTPANYYKVTFNINGKIVDPHIIIHH